MSTSSHHRAFAHHLLVIEYRSDAPGSLKSLLEPHGFRISSAGSTGQAIDEIRRTNLDLVVLEVLTAQLDGREILQFLQDKRPDIPLIVITDNPAAATSLKSAAFAIIRKPFTPDELLQSIRNALEKRRLEFECKMLQQRMQQSEQLHRFVVNNSSDIIYSLNEHGHITFINDSVERLLNVPREQLLGQHFSVLMGEEELRLNPYVFNERRTAGRKSQNRELRLRRRVARDADGKTTTLSVPFEINAVGVYEIDRMTAKKQFRGTHGIARDITDRKQAESFMRFQAYHDLLTGLPNRALFRDRLSLAISHAKRCGNKVAVMFLNVDRFKVVNDALGHSLGDMLIQAIARRISACLREGDTLSRFGGDEFTLLLPNINSQQDAAIIARKIIAELKSVFAIEQHEMYVSGSLGVALYPDHGDQVDHLIQHADIAMHYIKSHGKNGFQFFSEQMSQEFSERLVLERDLRTCLEQHQDQLFLQYQPIYNMTDGSVYALEAFLRWHHPAKGILLPGSFLPVAEDTGLLIELGTWVVEQVCQDLEQWQNPVLKIAINFSPLQVEHPDFEMMLMCAMQKHNVSPNQIEIEITEQLLNRDTAAIAAKLKRLTRLGFSIAVDNFGTGHSSLSCLHQLPIHTLKLDQSFLRQIDDESNSGDACIVNAIAAMASGLNLNLVAEGVETVAQKDYLRRLGCSTMQGYLFQKPVNSSEARHITIAPLLIPD